MNHATAEVVVPSRVKAERPPTVPREDLYGPVHKGLRWLFSRLLVEMGQADFTDETSIARVVADLHHLLDICALHLGHENAHVHSAIERRKPGAIARLASDHEGHEQAILDLRRYAALLERALPETRAAHGRRLYLRFSAFVGENLVHMVEEEELAQGVLEEIYTAEELGQIHHDLVSSIEPAKMFSFLRIMLAGVDPQQRAALFGMAAANLPLDRTATLVAGLRGQIGEREWQDLATRFLHSV